MKKTISFLLALIVACSCFAFRSPEAYAFGAVWVKEYYKDKFGDKTDQFYITNKSQFKGTYNSDSVSNGKLGANLCFERDGEDLLASVILFLNGKEQFKNSTSSMKNYIIDIKRTDGSRFTTSGKMSAGGDRIVLNGTIDLADVLLSGGEVSIYIEDENKTNNYLFKAKSGNFKEIYNKEIFIPYQEEQYQIASQLLNDKKYNEAVQVLESISRYNYKDSAAMLAEAREKKNIIENTLVDVHGDYLDQICDILAVVIGDSSKVKIGENGNIVFSDSVFFDIGSPDVKTSAEPTLNQMIEIFSQLLTHPENAQYVDNIVISCHTDSTGTDESKRQLSSNRANAILSYLLGNSGGKLKQYSPYFSSIGYGDICPLANNDTEEGRAKNRRIEVLIILKPEELLGVTKDAILENDFASIHGNLLKQIYDDLSVSMKNASNVKIGDNGNIVLDGDVFFDNGSSVVKSASDSILNKLIEIFSELLTDADMARYIDNIVISCHTDSLGSDESNRQISSDRAHAVLSYLLENGGGKLMQYAPYFTAIGYGESRPVAFNDTEEGRAQNRRIEISILLNEEEVLDATK